MAFGVTQIHVEPFLFFFLKSMIYFIQTLGLGSTEEKEILQKILKYILLDQNSNISQLCTLGKLLNCFKYATLPFKMRVIISALWLWGKLILCVKSLSLALTDQFILYSFLHFFLTFFHLQSNQSFLPSFYFPGDSAG